MPEIAAMIATVALVTQFLKTLITKANIPIVIEGKTAVILSLVVSAGVVAYYQFTTQAPFTFATAVLFIQVAIGANAGYSLLKVARNPA